MREREVHRRVKEREEYHCTGDREGRRRIVKRDVRYAGEREEVRERLESPGNTSTYYLYKPNQ